MYAKKSGITSFASLWDIKHSFKTNKVGHTGTLDNFADGLLVVLINGMTKFVPHITNFDKTYEGIIKFGEQTDTLDPTGNVVATSGLPSKDVFLSVLKNFLGESMQTPPAFSAIHLNGSRASDLARNGKSVEIPSRKINIYSLECLDFVDGYAHIKVKCSKGTYVRSLARDLAVSCGCVGHLVALRRTEIGPFKLCDAVGYENLESFSISSYIRHEKKGIVKNNIPIESLYSMNKEIASFCKLRTVHIKDEFLNDFFNGKLLKFSFFNERFEADGEYAVFFENTEGERFCGVISFFEKRFSYVFVMKNI